MRYSFIIKDDGDLYTRHWKRTIDKTINFFKKKWFLSLLLLLLPKIRFLIRFPRSHRHIYMVLLHSNILHLFHCFVAILRGSFYFVHTSLACVMVKALEISSTVFLLLVVCCNRLFCRRPAGIHKWEWTRAKVLFIKFVFLFCQINRTHIAYSNKSTHRHTHQQWETAHNQRICRRHSHIYVSVNVSIVYSFTFLVCVTTALLISTQFHSHSTQHPSDDSSPRSFCCRTMQLRECGQSWEHFVEPHFIALFTNWFRFSSLFSMFSRSSFAIRCCDRRRCRRRSWSSQDTHSIGIAPV